LFKKDILISCRRADKEDATMKRATVLLLAAVGLGCSGGSNRAPRPTRMIVLGDSIAACSNLNGKDDPNCSARMLADYVTASYAPALSYENLAVGGAVTTDVSATQLGTVTTGPGHVLVLVFVGGNDLARHLIDTDAGAEAGLTTDLPVVTASWDAVHAFFADKAKFPDGYTMIMNNQYDPFDDCTAAPYFLSAKKIELLHRFNDALQGIATANGAELTDQFSPFLGHGHHYNVASCPHYQPQAAPWMGDLIHPNPAGHLDLFAQWKQVVDGLYR
jgi:GDSL-like lipase/acylhydrolase family protein